MKTLQYLTKRFFFRVKNYGILNSFSKVLEFFKNGNKINLDKLKINPDLSLNDIFLTFGTDKGYLDGKKTFEFLKKTNNLKFNNYYEWICRKNIHDFEYALGGNYTPFYLKYFEKIKNNNLKILEIGVANGHSVASFSFYFPNAKLFGVDIKDPRHVFYSGSRISYKKVDIVNDKEVKSYLKNNHSFDIIIDDSLHTYEGHTTNLKNFFPALKKGGMYILEDYNATDEVVERITKWNQANKKNVMVFGYNTFEDVLNNISKKKHFDCEILSKDTQNYLMDNVSGFESYRSEHPHGSIAFIHKS